MYRDVSEAMAAELFEASPLAEQVSNDQRDLRDRDLGFGSIVGRDSRRRLLNRDGSFNVVRRGFGVRDAWAPYHLLLTMTWSREPRSTRHVDAGPAWTLCVLRGSAAETRPSTSG